jgi:hypothetical protein
MPHGPKRLLGAFDRPFVSHFGRCQTPQLNHRPAARCLTGTVHPQSQYLPEKLIAYSLHTDPKRLITHSRFDD